MLNVSLFVSSDQLETSGSMTRLCSPVETSMLRVIYTNIKPDSGLAQLDS